MIIDGVLNWVFTGLTWLVGLLPSITFDCSGISAISGYMNWVGGYVNLTLFASVLGFMITTELIIWGVQLVVWLYDKIPLT